MSYRKTIVCLANSRKYSGRCIAGKEERGREYGPWIRPVSDRPQGEVTEDERRYRDGRDPRVLDIIVIPLLSHSPAAYQTENHVIDPAYYWAKTGSLPWTKLEQLADQPETLWRNGDSSFYGLNDRVRVEAASTAQHSLVLIAPEALTIQVREEGGEFDHPRRRLRARFQYRREAYCLPVTDPVAERAYLAREDGDYPVSEVYLCVSLGEAHTDGCCYKLVATVIAKRGL
jgi:hypothetical protein